MQEPLTALGLTLGLSAGALAPDASFENYRWDTSLRSSFGARAMVEAGAFAGGLRGWTAETTQSTGLEGTSDLAVRLSAISLGAEWRAVSMLGTDLVLGGSIGRVHIGYDPDHLTLDVDGTRVDVTFTPIDEWLAGASLALRRSVTGRLTAGIRADVHAFSLDTAHRNGDTIERNRERFTSYGLALELGYRYALH